MARILELLPDVAAFEQHLLTAHKKDSKLRYSSRTAHAYAVTANKALCEDGDFVVALMKVGPSPKWNMVYNAGLAWARWRGDDELEARIKGLEPPEINYRETKPPSVPDWNRITAAVRARVSDPQRSVILLIATTGLRIDEVFQLTRRQAELAIVNREIVIVQKGKHKRNWAPSSDDRALLKTLLRYSSWETLRDVVHPAPDPSHTEQQRYYAAYHVVRKCLQTICADAGVEYVRPHRYRHAVANDLIQLDGATVIDVQQALGHADSRTTDKFYLHSDADRQAALKDRAAARRKGMS